MVGRSALLQLRLVNLWQLGPGYMLLSIYIIQLILNATLVAFHLIKLQGAICIQNMHNYEIKYDNTKYYKKLKGLVIDVSKSYKS